MFAQFSSSNIEILPQFLTFSLGCLILQLCRKSRMTPFHVTVCLKTNWLGKHLPEHKNRKETKLNDGKTNLVIVFTLNKRKIAQEGGFLFRCCASHEAAGCAAEHEDLFVNCNALEDKTMPLHQRIPS